MVLCAPLLENFSKIKLFYSDDTLVIVVPWAKGIFHVNQYY